MDQMLFFYVSLASFKHKVYKCAGMVASESHKAYYEAYFQERGAFGQGPEKGPFKVEVCEYRGDRIML